MRRSCWPSISDARPTVAQVIEAKEQRAGTTFAYQAEDLLLQRRFGLYAPDDVPDYPVASPEQRQRYVFYANDDGLINGGTVECTGDSGRR